MRRTTRAIKTGVVGLYKLARFTALCSVVGLCIYTLSNLAIIETNYMVKYEDAYSQMIREHDRQLLAGNMIRSQQGWERSSDAIRTSYLDARAERSKLELQLEITQHEIYAFTKMLDKLCPGMTEEVLEELGPPRVPLRPDVLPDDEDDYYGTKIIQLKSPEH